MDALPAARSWRFIWCYKSNGGCAQGRRVPSLYAAVLGGAATGGGSRGGRLQGPPVAVPLPGTRRRGSPSTVSRAGMVRGGGPGCFIEPNMDPSGTWGRARLPSILYPGRECTSNAGGRRARACVRTYVPADAASTASGPVSLRWSLTLVLESACRSSA
jgi:hypothetical protein